MAEQRLPDDIAALAGRLRESWKTTNGDVLDAANKLEQQARVILALKKIRNEMPEVKNLLSLADSWEKEIAVAYNEYSHGQRAAYESAASELREVLGHERDED